MSVHSDPSYAEGVFIGHVTVDELRDCARSVVREANLIDPPRILADLSAMTGGHSPADLAELAEEFEWKPGTREAIVMPRQMSTHDLGIRAWGDRCAAAGLDLRLFDNLERAIDWLVAE